MKHSITANWIYLDSENKKEAECLKRFIFGNKRTPQARFLFLNGAHISQTKAGLAIRKLSEVELSEVPSYPLVR